MNALKTSPNPLLISAVGYLHDGAAVCLGTSLTLEKFADSPHPLPPSASITSPLPVSQPQSFVHSAHNLLAPHIPASFNTHSPTFSTRFTATRF